MAFGESRGEVVAQGWLALDRFSRNLRSRSFLEAVSWSFAFCKLLLRFVSSSRSPCNLSMSSFCAERLCSRPATTCSEALQSRSTFSRRRSFSVRLVWSVSSSEQRASALARLERRSSVSLTASAAASTSLARRSRSASASEVWALACMWLVCARSNSSRSTRTSASKALTRSRLPEASSEVCFEAASTPANFASASSQRREASRQRSSSSHSLARHSA
mmetsp:Transcript_44310/g.126863  ORF Transcript_44310/g.126863 Transcript_44310/m.126863 type:complete len:219 (-) Transcript_44310:155-811(-)